MARLGHRGGTFALLLAAGVIALGVPSIPASAAGGCATPGRDGTATLNGVINTYYPGSGTASGSGAITLGAATGAATPIAIGDLLLVIQMQDAAINSTNTGAYGDGVAGDPATGWTALNSAGLYEYAVATSAVPLAGGSLTVSSALINTYTQAAPTATQGQRDFQVIRVPQYVAATLTAGLTAASFNGSTGGVLVFDVDGALNLNGAAVSVSQSGFRGGLGRQLAGGAGGTGTDYVNLSANNFHGQKGEGIAGTPQYVFNSLSGTTANNGVDGYPNGSTARGAPGTAGGSGTDPNPTANDQNTGGGGGANGGTGGMGGNSWNTNLAMGGFGGTAFPATAARLTAGAGGGAGTRNNSGAIANASSGGSGGGIVMIRTGSVTGAGTLTANGGTGVVPDNDGGGGGGSGGSVVVVTQTGGLAGLTINARGGAGANAWPTSAGGAGVNYHGPGGGGGGGVVLTTSAPTAVSVLGGVNGTTTTDLAAYGATPGAGGTSAIITAGTIPGAGSGASCTSDLTIAKSHTDPFVRGSTGTYALTISNIGGTATSGTSTVTDTLPAGLTPTAASGTGWTCGIVAQTVTCTSTAVVAFNGSFPVISVTVNVAQSTANSVTNTATVSGGGEVNTANDTATDLTNVVSRADIAVAKIASSGTVVVGSNVTFTVTVTNNGPSDATGVQITDQLPAGLTFVSATPSQGTYTSGTGVWNIGAIASGAVVTLALTATVTAPGPLTNSARKTAENETDPNLSNDSASVTITGQAPDLTIAKSHVGSFVRGSTGSYSVTVSNIGAATSSGLVTVSDTLPVGLAPSTASGTGWSCSIAGQAVTCTRSDALGAGASYPVITIAVTVSQAATSPLINTATVAGGNEVNTANDSASDSTAIVSQADIGVTKIASSGTVTVGSDVTFTITASNLGPTNATGVQVTDLLPAGLTFVAAVPSQGTYTSGTGVWNIGAIASGSSVTLSITATATRTGALINTATKTAENEPDPNASNDSASATVNGQAPDLTITKSHTDPFVRGTTNTYQLLVSNLGSVATSGLVTVSDTLPAGLTPSTATGTGWTCGVVVQTVTCTRSDALAAAGFYPTITITVTVLQTAAASLTNTATVAGGNEVNTANDTASDPTTVTSLADIAINKTASSGSVIIGSNVTFTITASNLGPSNATGVHVTDTMSAGLTFVSAVPSQGIYTSGTGDWNIGAIASGSSATLTLTAMVNAPGALANTATKSAENESDPNSGNDSSTATVNSLAPDVTISKSHADPFVRGTAGTYNLIVTNIGATATFGLVTVTDTLPAGLTPSVASGTGWACGLAGQTVTCTRSDALAPAAAYPTITISVTVLQTAPGAVTNSATVGGGGEVNTGNDTATDPTTITSLADVAVTKSASAPTVTVGSNVTFTITARDIGPSNATGVQVTDLLPSGLTFVAAVPSAGTYTSGTGVWNIGPLASGSSATLTLVASVTQTGSITNTATKTAENETDPNLSNDSSSVTITGQAPDLTIAKSHVGSFVRGSTGSYSLTVSNIGTVASIGLVTVSDTLPAGLTPSTASGTGWTCGVAGQAVTCTRSDALGAAASYPVITIAVTVGQAATSPLTNTATVAGGNEINTANDSASDSTTIVSQADIGVTKFASSGTVTVGSNVTFTITATNFGPTNATGVQVTDLLPAGLTYVSSVPSQGTYTSGTGVWNIGAIASGGSVTLSLTARVTATGALINTATKTAETEPDPNASNDSASATVNGQAPDLIISKSHVDPFVRGTTNTYQLVVSNIGSAATSGTVTVADTLPAGLTPSTATGTGWGCGIAAQTVTCTRNDALATSASYPAITITVTVLQSAPVSVTNNATVAGGNEVNTANDTATDPTNIASLADIGVSKSANGSNWVVGQNVTFTITASNLGPSNATGVQVTDPMPAGLTFVSAVPSQGTYTSGTGLWDIGAIASGGSATLTLVATVTQPGAITNTATKSAENESDPNPANNSASATINGFAPDMTIAKAHVGSFLRGSTGSYSVTVSNIGPVASSGLVTVSDTLPAGLTPSTAAGTGWGCAIAGQVVTCTRSNALLGGASYPVITITVAISQSATSPLTNTATVAGGNEINTSNDSASDSTVITSQADVGLTKIASSATVTTGSNVTFTITAHNAGPSDATGVQVTDPLPNGLTLVSATTSTGTFATGTGVWTIGSLASGASATLTVVATVTTTGPVLNTARKTAENEPDPNPGNDVSSTTVTGTGLPGPPNGGMAPVSSSDSTKSPAPALGARSGRGLGGSLFLGATLVGFLGLIFLRRRSHRVAVVAGMMAFTTLATLVTPAPAFSSPSKGTHLTVRPSDLDLFGKPISTVKPEIGTLASTLHPANGPITPYRIRIPALGIDTLVEPVGTAASGLMDVPGNIWSTAWLRTGVKPGASGQAVIDGHLDSVKGSAVFSDLHRLHQGDRIYVSDADGRELTFSVNALQVLPLDGFPTLRVFGPAHGRFLNLITCAGHFDPARRTYDHRLVVFAELL